MIRYYKEIDGKVVFFKNPLVVGGMSIFNPSEEILFAAGWQVYVEPEPSLTEKIGGFAKG